MYSSCRPNLSGQMKVVASSLPVLNPLIPLMMRFRMYRYQWWCVVLVKTSQAGVGGWVKSQHRCLLCSRFHLSQNGERSNARVRTRHPLAQLASYFGKHNVWSVQVRYEAGFFTKCWLIGEAKFVNCLFLTTAHKPPKITRLPRKPASNVTRP